MSKETFLIFDLADRPGRIGILEDSRVIVWHPLTEGLRSRKIVETVHAFLKERKVKLSQVSAFMSVTRGSSFTGMRLGASVANAWAWIFNRPAVGVGAAPTARSLQAAYKGAKPNTQIEITYPLPNSR